MALLLDLLWLALGGGFLVALQYLLAGLLLCVTVVGIPFGLQCFKLARLAAFPFGKDIKVAPFTMPGSPLRLLGNVLWFLCAGVWIFLTQLGLAIGSAVTIIGIPFAIQHIKLAVLALWPFGRVAELD